jgi:integrase/recombinase XerC
LRSAHGSGLIDVSNHAPYQPDTPNPRPEASPTLAEAARLIREAVRDKSYQLTPIGADAAGYLRAKRKRLTDSSYRDYECCLDKLARHFLDLHIEDFEPPTGTERIEEFLDALWGSGASRTYNKNLSIIKDFFRFQIMRGRLHGDPTLLIERARSRQVYRTTFSTDQRRAIISEQPDLRDRLCLRLLLDYGLRKGALQAVQFKHFDHQRKRLTIFTKGQKVRELPLPHRAFWHDLEHHILDISAQPSHYLLCTQRTIPRVGVRRYPEKPMSGHAAHDWWYRCLATAGIVAPGTTSGEKMHKSRHTAGQRVLDATGNLKAVQKLLGHASIQRPATSTPTGTSTSSLPRWPTCSPQTRTTKRPIRNRSPRHRRKNRRFAAETRNQWRRWCVVPPHRRHMCQDIGDTNVRGSSCGQGAVSGRSACVGGTFGLRAGGLPRGPSQLDLQAPGALQGGRP